MALRERTETKLLDAAEELFFTRGVAATPIDVVLEQAGVSSATLYRGYPTKEALVAAALDRRHRYWLDTWQRAVDQAHDPTAQLLAVFDAADDIRASPGGARWCAFLGTAAEYAQAPDEIAAAVQQDTDALRDRLTALARPVVGDRAPALAEQLLLVFSGELAMRLREPGHTATDARAIATTLITAARHA